MPIQWKKSEGVFLESSDGRFRIEPHWDQKPGYYELIDNQNGGRERKRDTKQKNLKAEAEEIVQREARIRHALFDRHMVP